MYTLQHIETFTGSSLNLISGLDDLDLVLTNGNLMLYAGSRSGGGVLALDVDQAMTLVDSVTFSIISKLPVAATLDVVMVSGRQHLMVSGSNQNAVLTYRIDPDGGIGVLTKLPTSLAGVIAAQSVVTIGATQYLYAVRADEGIIRAYSLAYNGATTLVGTIQAAPDAQGVPISRLLSLTVDGQPLLIALSMGEEAVLSYRILPGGGLEAVETLGAAEGLPIADPAHVSAFSAWGRSYLMVASASSSTLSVIEIASSGAMTVTDHVADTLDTRFQGLRAVETVVVNDRVLVFAGGGDGGLTLFEVLPDGRMTVVGQELDLPATALDSVTSIAAHVVNGQIELFVGGEGAGISRFTMALGGIAAPLAGGTGADALTGGTGGDLLAGGDGNDTLSGGAGNDILMDGAGSDSLSGGAGSDIFVLAADGRAEVITDFQLGIDRIDLTAWGAVYALSGLTLTATATGLTVQYRDEMLTIRSANGLTIAPHQLQVRDFFPLWHLATLNRDVDGTILGTDDADFLHGTAQDDVFLWSDGSDTIIGDTGRDRMDFRVAAQHIVLDLEAPQSNAGAVAGQIISDIEIISATTGNDTIYGNGQAEALHGEVGNDVLAGRLGNDSLFGGAGDDVLVGGAGADSLDGGAGFDTAGYWNATSGIGLDLVTPSLGFGEGQGDRLTGIEAVIGSNHADTISGDAGANSLAGSLGNDRLLGREGVDSLMGGDGSDLLLGGQGADVLNGGAGSDQAAYWYAAAGLVVDLQAPQANTGEAAGDVFVSIEGLSASAFADTVSGDAAGNFLNGYLGNDVLSGRGGADVLFGDHGNDVLIGGEAGDVLNGGAGIDHAGYWGAASGVTADLQAPQTNTGEAAGDSYAGIENLSGSSHADALWGDGLGNYIGGYLGNDTIGGRGGNDVLAGDAGNDILIGGSGADWLDGGAGRDQVAYWHAAAAVSVNLNDRTQNRGEAAGDTFVAVEDVSGSAHADTLAGNADGNFLNGWLGNDLLLGWLGDDALMGGDGNDTLQGGQGNDYLIGGAGADEFVFNGGADTVADFQDNTDTLAIGSNVWGGAPRSIDWVLEQADVVAGGVSISFAPGLSVFLAGVTSIAALADDLVIV